MNAHDSDLFSSPAELVLCYIVIYPMYLISKLQDAGRKLKKNRRGEGDPNRVVH